MRKYIKIILLILLAGLIIGGWYVYGLITETPHFRTSQDKFDLGRMITHPKRCMGINYTGLADANFSGSGAINFEHLDHFRKNLKTDLIVVNGVGDGHYYMNGKSIRHLCYKEVDGKLVSRYRGKKNFCLLRRFIAGAPMHEDDIEPGDVYSEIQKLDSMGIKHTDSLPLSWVHDWSFMGTMVDYFEKIDPKQTHLHFHCEHGKGRTSTLMVLYDIFRNASKVPLQDIIDRQYCLSGEDLNNTKVWKNGTWTEEGLISRRNQVYAFYDYMLEGYGKVSWNEWLAKKEEEGYPYLAANVEDKSQDAHRDGNN